jgi:DNA-binding response OmpR family regulator
MKIDTTSTHSAGNAMDLFLKSNFELVIIHDGIRPDQALELCRSIRNLSTVPILMLTSRDEVLDEHMCLNAGADDYIIKPFETRILNSRIEQQLRRVLSRSEPVREILTWENLTLDTNRHSFEIDGNQVPVTSSEFQFLLLLMSNPNRVFSRSQILEAVGVKDGVGADHIVDSHASRIRQKVRSHGGPEIIAVVRSVGFRLAQN